MFTLFLGRFLPLALFTLLAGGAIFLLERSSHLDLLYKFGKIQSIEEQSPLTIALEQHQIITISAVTLLALVVAAPIAWFRAARQRQDMIVEHQNRENLRSIKLLLDSTIEGIYGTDEAGHCILANRSCANLLGYTHPEQLLGKEMHRLMHHSHADGSPYPASACRAHQMVSTGSAPVLVTDEVFWRQDGSCFPVSYSAHPIQENGQNIGMVCTFVDISERRLLEDQLRHAQKMEAVGQLAGGIAHDFNNILQIISGNTQILQFDSEQSNQKQPQLLEILKAVERGTALTRSMLAFSRKQTIHPVTFELNQMVKDSLLLAQKLLSKNITLQLEQTETALVITADEILLQQVLFNLITNARDAMPNGGTITVATVEQVIDESTAGSAQGALPGTYAVLKVRDTGQGIPEEIRQKIFEPFFTTKGVGKGTGLGLSMIYGTIKQHGGFVLAESTEGQGSCFSVFLPAISASILPNQHTY
ncbi:PAS domain S-box-containing protein [Trichlorobacter thiogenes]|uniref:histidine kinase n=2 Tax=Trichlorobacter thiogenes TaxID=115783 RepID=A0A1T4QQ30_9BACT|nr:PAS domain S-box-containing protein [Trichlorobacter thiogenes]